MSRRVYRSTYSRTRACAIAGASKDGLWDRARWCEQYCSLGRRELCSVCSVGMRPSVRTLPPPSRPLGRFRPRMRRRPGQWPALAPVEAGEVVRLRQRRPDAVAVDIGAARHEAALAARLDVPALGGALNTSAMQVRQAFYGEEAQRIQRGRDDVRVIVRYPRDERRSLGDLETMRIRTPDGGQVPFSQVGVVEPGRGFASVRRVDRNRAVNVTASIDPGATSADAVIPELNARILPEVLAGYPGVFYTGCRCHRAGCRRSWPGSAAEASVSRSAGPTPRTVARLRDLSGVVGFYPMRRRIPRANVALAITVLTIYRTSLVFEVCNLGAHDRSRAGPVSYRYSESFESHTAKDRISTGMPTHTNRPNTRPASP